jgi:methyltransferase-like protein/SAM-dependent methyltransferase
VTETPSSYDEVPYGDYAFPYSHPDRLAAVGTLLGMRPPPPERCRVLELGCGVGGNLIPMALALPGGHFLGVDLSARQVATGNEAVRALGLTNIDLRPLSILDLDASLGRFDYIICHGVYSWVPSAVQDKILEVCRDNLQPDGIAYVSYNTYPGWHLRGMVREMLRYHVRQFTRPQEQVQQARALLDFLLESLGDRESAYGKMLKGEAELLAEASDTYVYHEHLEDVNYPLYFHQFMERAAARGLQYLAESQPSPLPADLSPSVLATLQGLAGDLIQGEQYLDFVRSRTFRRTLLCHAAVAVRRPPDPRALEGLQVTGRVRPVSERPDVASAQREEFRTPGSAVSLFTNNPLVKGALVALAESAPRAVPFAELWGALRGHAGGEGAEALAEPLLQCYLAGLVELHAHAARFPLAPGERPVASPLARLQAAGSSTVTNLCHRTVGLNEFERQLLRRLDGTQDRAAVLDSLAEAVRAGELTIEQEDGPVRDVARARELMAAALEPTLERLARFALLSR